MQGAIAHAVDRGRSTGSDWHPNLERQAHALYDQAGDRELLLVDDDAGFVESLSALLQGAGFAVCAEFTFPSALRYLSSHTPDALITDLHLGEADGWTLVRYATTHQPLLPVVVVTGWSWGEPAVVEDRTIPVFVKPFDPDALLAYLEAIFRR